jgi:hypothetical protein
MSKFSYRGAMQWALMVPLALGAGQFAFAQEEDAGGPVIQIGKGDAEDLQNLSQPGLTDGAIVDPHAPKYWIGLLGGTIGPDHPLRAHIDIPEHQGLLVANVMPESPAAKAGLKTNDILLRANGVELNEMQNLVDLVLTEGEKHGKIEVEVLRRGQRETVYVTPEERPADVAQPQLGGGPEIQGLPGGINPQDLLREMPFEFRNFGPGVILDGHGGVGIDEMPSGVSVSINKQDGQPARITVKRGEETWEVVGDDPASLKQLPEDLRPFVERMLQGRTMPGRNHHQPGEHMIPDFGDGRLRERLERMEQRMEELQERMLERSATPTTPPADNAEVN